MKSQKLSPFVNMAVKTAFAKLSVSNTVNSNIKSSLPITQNCKPKFDISMEAQYFAFILLDRQAKDGKLSK